MFEIDKDFFTVLLWLLISGVFLFFTKQTMLAAEFYTPQEL